MTMQHRRARRYLVDLAEGSLDRPLRDEVREHVNACSACDSWIATYRMVEGEFDRPSEHLDTGLIAAYCVEPGDLSSDDRAQVEAHLRQCTSCTSEYRWTLRALAESRPDYRTVDSLDRERKHAISRPAWVAAGLLAATLVVALFAVRPQPEDRALTDAVIHDHRVVESDRLMVARNLQLSESSDLRLRAPQGVALGQGVSVRKGARLSISTGAEFTQ